MKSLSFPHGTAQSLALAILVALAGGPVAAQAQVAPAAGSPHAPGVDPAANGTPVVNIVAPNQRGVSHNQYHDFNVDSRGLVLNNSGAVSQAQQAGYIVGNPNLANGASARIIVNEVTSRNASQLRGFTEVAGQRAEVVIANPNGISCDGCGFINTSRGTMVTGTPLFGGDGSLAAFRVTRGHLAIDGAGLNAAGTDRLDLIARTVAANAKAWANELNVVTGANEVDYASLNARAIAGEGAAGVSLDVAALGGMYANKIRLVGTEAGVGVRNAGELATQGGDFTITQAGRLELTGKTSSTGQLGIQAAALANSGTLAAGGNVTIATAGAIDNTGTIYAANDAALRAGGSLDNRGKLYAVGGSLDIHAAGFGNAAAGDVYAGKQLALRAGDITNEAGIESGAGLLLQASGTMQNAGTVIAGAAARLEGGDIENSGRLSLAGAATLWATRTLLNRGTLVSGGDTSAHAAGITNHGHWQSGGDMAVSATSFSLGAEGVLYAERGLALDVDGVMDNAGQVYAAGNLGVRAGALDNVNTLRAGGDLAVDVAGDLRNSGKLLSDAGNVTLAAADRLTNTGTTAARGNLMLNAGTLVSSGVLGAGIQADGSLGSAGIIDAAVAGALSVHGDTLAASGLTLTAASLDLTEARLRTAGDISLTAREGGIDTGSANVATAGALALQAAGAISNRGGALQGGTMAITAGSLDNTDGTITQTGSADQVLSVAGGLDNSRGRITSNGKHVTVRASSIVNNEGAIEHAGDGVLTMRSDAGIANRLGRIVGNGALDLDAQGALDSTGGTISLAKDITLKAASIANDGGTLVGSMLAVTSAGTLSNDAGVIQSGGALTLDAGSLANGSGQIKGVSGDMIRLGIANALSNGGGGFIGGNGGLWVRAGALENAGQLYAGTSATVAAAGHLVNRGAIQAMGTLSVAAGTVLDNDGGRIEGGSGDAAAELTVSSGWLTNVGGRIANGGAGQTRLNIGGAIDNRDGTLGGQGNVTVSGASIDNGGGRLVAGSDLALSTGNILNTGGNVYAAGTLDWHNGGAVLTNIRGEFGAGARLALTLAWLENLEGNASSNGDVALSLSGGIRGGGRVIAGRDLDISLPGDFVNGAGSQYKANRHFGLHLGGAFYNSDGATLESVGALTIDAASIDNGAGARVSSAATTLNSRGRVTNRGRLEGDSLAVNGTDIDNTGSMIGDTITVRANNLTNGADLGDATDNAAYQSALIAATQDVRLLVGGTFLNRDAMVFALGDIFIAADDAGSRTQAIINRSGSIEADQRVTLAANQITNERRVFETETVHLADGAVSQSSGPVVRYAYNDPDPNHRPPNIDPSQVVSAEEVELARAYCESNGYDNHRCIGFRKDGGIPTSFEGSFVDTLVSYERLKRTSAEGRIVGGTDIVMSGSVTNDKSTVAAGNNLVINGAGQGAVGPGDTAIGGEIIRNIAWAPTGTVRTVSSYGVGWEALVHDPRRWVPDGFRIYGKGSSTSTIALGDGQRPAWITIDPGQGLASRMTAGGALEFHGEAIENTTVGADGKPIIGVQLGANAGGGNVIGKGPGAVGHAGGDVDLGGLGDDSGNSHAGPRPGSQSIGSPDAPAGQIRLPASGLYTTHPGSGSPYLIETDPRFASKAGFLGSDYLMSRLGFDGTRFMKRLGDGFYEQRMVLDQITSLTGRRYLTDNTDAMAQYRALMDAGVEAAGDVQLAVGVALTAEQMAGLTQDIVWMVSQEVNGEKVLVPVVYLSAAHAQEVAQGGAILSGKSVVLDASGALTNTGTIAASGDASLKAGTLLNAGNLTAGGDLSVTAAQDILNGGVIKGGNVSLAAGNDIRSGADIGRVDLGGLKLGDAIAPFDAARLGLASGGSIAATGDLAASAGRDLALGNVLVTSGGDMVLSAKRDLSLAATSVKAGGDAALAAGRDLSLSAVGQTAAVQGGTYNSESTVHSVSTVEAGGNAVLAAGRDVVSEGARVKAGDQLAVSAGRDVVLNAVTDTYRSESHGKDGTKAVQTRTMDEALAGTSLTSNRGVSVSAGHDIRATAAAITSDVGGVALAAKSDISLNAGQERHTWEQRAKSVKSGATSSTTKKTFDASLDNLAVGTLISGDTVAVAAGHDITTHGAQIGATGDVVMAAGNNLTIGTAETTHSETHDRTVSKSGVMSGGGFSVMIGASKEQTGYEQTDSTPTGSFVGSTDGNVVLSAGNLVHITGSDVLTTRDTAIIGKDVTIDAALATTDTHETYKKQTAGIHLGLTGGVVSAAQAAYGMSKRAGQVEDSRLKALYAAGAAASAYGAYAGGAQAVEAASASGAASDAGVSLRIGIGASSVSSDSKTHAETAVGSNLRAGGNLAIAATGGDLNIVGSHLDGSNIALAAARDLNILSQAENHSNKSTNKNGSGEIGFSVGSQTGIYVTAATGKGKATGNGVTHAESTINASNTLQIISGNNTTIQGGLLAANQVVGVVGGNLTLRSEQDTDDYASKQKQMGGTFVYGYGGSANFSSNKAKGHLESVNEVTGIRTGDGGFQLAVGGNTHLAGAVLDSAADASKNVLNTGSLSYESIKNKSSYESSGVTVAGSYNGNARGEQKVSMGGTSLQMPMDKSREGTTKSAIAQGALVIRDGSVSDISRDPSSVGGQVVAYDPKKMAEKKELIGAVLGTANAVTDAVYDAREAQKNKEIADLNNRAREAEAAGKDADGQALRMAAFAKARERDNPSWSPSTVKTVNALGASVLSGNVDLKYLATTGAIARVGDAWTSAGKGFNETQAVKVTCTRPVSDCAGGNPKLGAWSEDNLEGDWELPTGQGVGSEERIAALKKHGYTIELVDTIPSDARNLATNGILNDLARASQLFVGYTERADPDVENTTFYLQYNQTHGGLSDLMQAGWDKFISPLNGEYSATSTALASAIVARGSGAFNVLGHSLGSITTRNALFQSVDAGYINPKLSVAVFGAAVRPTPLVDSMKTITGKEIYDLIGRENISHAQLTFLDHPNDPVSSLVGMNVFPSPYLDPTSSIHIPGASQSNFWGAIKGLADVFGGSVNPHSCQGLNCMYRPDMNWTIKSPALESKNSREGSR
ncbi:filamentous hemagglutinin N-terminal domain-containing protein [Luteibacter pinisoli]|uniref:Filamentous hemagglutinin N-terminal domain-containing protein n=1 Tax=Luteibacter pinisoli TaxID=2589080 RepID=A0A4Y5Z7K4_9GAMM|nr:hemagglutinin repeat-containing protein [Luteibacter pinisoli]QDE41214.1 filamentous hemagglutinin N-terminal domain-containing protein [Luteibacter pinisoli]